MDTNSNLFKNIFIINRNYFIVRGKHSVHSMFLWFYSYYSSFQGFLHTQCLSTLVISLFTQMNTSAGDIAVLYQSKVLLWIITSVVLSSHSLIPPHITDTYPLFQARTLSEYFLLEIRIDTLQRKFYILSLF